MCVCVAQLTDGGRHGTREAHRLLEAQGGPGRDVRTAHTVTGNKPAGTECSAGAAGHGRPRCSPGRRWRARGQRGRLPKRGACRRATRRQLTHVRLWDKAKHCRALPYTQVKEQSGQALCSGYSRDDTSHATTRSATASGQQTMRPSLLQEGDTRSLMLDGKCEVTTPPLCGLSLWTLTHPCALMAASKADRSAPRAGDHLPRTDETGNGRM
jgi:hypothetical protein